MAYISGDGLAVSGVLTIFRNVVELAHDLGIVEYPVTTDLGYSWRPDKAPFYPDGAAGTGYPEWMRVSSAVPAGRRPDWFEREDIDWAVAANMTLSDAVPVTLALHRAARQRWQQGRAGGVLFWDHDLFRSYAVYEGEERVYPPVPSELTPLPQDVPYHRWIVPTADLATETAGYPTARAPEVIPYVLPTMQGTVPKDNSLTDAEFLAQQGISEGTPLIAAPVRVFRVKGAEIAVELIGAVRREAARRNDPLPILLVFGSLDEDPDYAKIVLAAIDNPEGVRFLGGVPLATYRDPSGRLHLDEVSLLRIAAASHGGLFYTPNRSDVESVGLGPALAATAGLPFAATSYDALAGAYGPGLLYVAVQAIGTAAAQIAGWLAGYRSADPGVLAALDRNRAIITDRFSPEPTRQLLLTMADAVIPKV